MDKQTWSGALKQVRATLGRWPIVVMLPIGLILPRYPEPWGTSLTLMFLGYCVGRATLHALEIHRTLKRHAEAERIEKECRLELCALTMQMNAMVTLHAKAASQGHTEAMEAARRELDRISEEQERVMQKWKSSIPTK